VFIYKNKLNKKDILMSLTEERSQQISDIGRSLKHDQPLEQ